MKYKHIPPGYKYCPQCERTLRVDDFYIVRGKPRGYCKECTKVMARARHSYKARRKKDDYLATGLKIMYKM